jgi:hypothetical protein
MNFKSAVIYWIHLPEHTDPSTEGYLGVSKNFELRMTNHITDINKKKHKNPHLVHAVLKYGWDNLIKDIILSGEEAYCYEIEEELRPKKSIGWNIAPGGHRGPGWTKGKKKSQSSITKEQATVAQNNEAKRKERQLNRKLRLEERENKKLAKIKAIELAKQKREEKRLAKAELAKIREIERNKRIEKRLQEGTYGIEYDRSKRPICSTCNANLAAINYTRKGKTYYRSMCDDCGRKKEKVKPRVPGWQTAGYKKKPTCDLCGFKGIFTSQLTVFHIDGNLENSSFVNLRTICLNCVEVVKRKEVTWKRGGLEVD